MTERCGYEDISIPQLMRGARDTYRDAVGRALVDVGCDDLPRNSTFVLAGLDRGSEANFSPQSDVVSSLGLSKQAASQLIDTLVLRRYLERRVDPQDRRRMEVRLTDRGQRAADAIQRGIDGVEAALAELITADELHGLRAGLAAFREIRQGPGG
jgi:DNA-binding MarR family transcriptional regulator